MSISSPESPSLTAPKAAPTPWKIQSFRAFATMRFSLGAAQEIMTVALAWEIFQRTHSTLALGLVGLSSFLPSILLSLVTGIVADRLDRRHIMLAACGTIVLCALALVLLSFSPFIWPIYIVVAVQGVARAFAQPASKAMVPNLAPPGMLSSVIAAATVVQGAATIIAPAIGALLLPLGNGIPFAVSGVCGCLAFAAAMVLGSQRARGISPARPNLPVMLEGFSFIWSRPKIMGAMGLDFVAVLFGSATALLPFYVTEVFHAGAWAMGALRTAIAVGALLMALFLTRYPIRRHVGPRLLMAVGLYGLLTVLFGLSTDIWIGIGLMLLLGATDTVSMITRNAMVQINTPDTMQGRVAAVHSVTTGASNDLGEFESGMVAHVIGGVPTVILGGVLAMLAALSWIWLFPAVRRTDRLEDTLPER
ncbi:MFS transporter [Roseiarcaceae bacterium H3SJ34-1]|uniref:MFS transporter n=1 Tax=Terripilifer ovatus TaxID=3032367 RepID=UPI003AB94C77|nr:MFS transporter [Roseiarcaceae bacterium H3SJ34-1]